MGHKFKLSKLGLTTEDSIDEALYESEEYLHNLNDVDDIFQESIIACLGIAEDIMAFVNNKNRVRPARAKDLEQMRSRLREHFTRMEGCWENLLRVGSRK